MSGKWLWVTVVVVLCVGLAMVVWSQDSEGQAPPESGKHCGARLGWMAKQLTPEQRQELKAKVQELKEQGAPKEEIHAAVKEMLASWGVEVSHDGKMGWMAKQLTAEQSQDLKAKITELKEQGASREEIHAAKKELLSSWGVEVPQGCHKGPVGGHTGEE